MRTKSKRKTDYYLMTAYYIYIKLVTKKQLKSMDNIWITKHIENQTTLILSIIYQTTGSNPSRHHISESKRTITNGNDMLIQVKWLDHEFANYI
ncbi:hypothetical protein BpHYR1_023386 [Brachionus plicatilis]|uniref:Uncharacterized protein n=1 Tax=Brachionus plicatilis TaxID=10195 RepID=A0A3M7QJ84_BRAPC|nr:hypothetical protein BpHYR1_023386 [Brachionus plicatilis]